MTFKDLFKQDKNKYVFLEMYNGFYNGFLKENFIL